MYRVTTPTHTFIMPIDTSECSVIQITYKQGCIELIKEYSNGILPSGMTLDEDSVIIKLTQEETRQFLKGTVDVQLRALVGSRDAYASDHFKIGVQEVNNQDILTGGGR